MYDRRHVLHSRWRETAGPYTSRHVRPAAASLYASSDASYGKRSVHLVCTNGRRSVWLSSTVARTTANSSHGRFRFETCDLWRPAIVRGSDTSTAHCPGIVRRDSRWPASIAPMRSAFLSDVWCVGLIIGSRETTRCDMSAFRLAMTTRGILETVDRAQTMCGDSQFDDYLNS